MPSSDPPSPLLRAVWPAAMLALVGVLALLWATVAAIGGGLELPLDDAYIHLGVARDLAEHGTWGVNPGQMASASSSPVWTGILALWFWAAGPALWPALVLNGLAGVAVLGLAAAELRDAGLDLRGQRWGLVALVLAVPLPFLMALGMEHTLQLASALALLRGAGGGGGVRLALLAGLAVLVRFEALFLVAGLVALLAVEGRGRAAAAVAGGAGIAAGGFALWSLSQGGPAVPASLLLKTPVGHDGWAGLVGNLSQAAPALGLGVAAAALAGPAEVPDGLRRRVGLFLGVLLAQVALARFGWLFRYEAWLIGWGALLVLTLAARAPRARLALLGLVVAAPLGVRAYEAHRLFVAGAVFNADTDVALARWVGAAWPEARVATQDLGALSFYTDVELVDLSGLGDGEVLRLRLDRAMTGPAVSALLERRGVDLALTGADWMAGDLPAAFHKTGLFSANFPGASANTDTVIWAVSPEARAVAGARLRALREALSPRVTLTLTGSQTLDLSMAEVEGAAVQIESGGVAFYTGGRGCLRVPAAGALTLRVQGSLADGRGPRFRVERAAGVTALEVGAEPRTFEIGPVQAGERVCVVYEDDHVDASGGDRNLFLRAATVDPG